MPCTLVPTVQMGGSQTSTLSGAPRCWKRGGLVHGSSDPGLTPIRSRALRRDRHPATDRPSVAYFAILYFCTGSECPVLWMLHRDNLRSGEGPDWAGYSPNSIAPRKPSNTSDCSAS